MNLPQDFLIRMKAELGAGFESFLKSYENEPARAVRVNRLRSISFKTRIPLPFIY